MARTEEDEPLTYWEKKRDRALRARRLRRILQVVVLFLGTFYLFARTDFWKLDGPPEAPLEPTVSMGRDLNDLLEPIRERFELPGLAAALIDGQSILASGAVGVRRLGGDEAVTVHDRWHIGSCTKAITATQAGILVDRGVMDWSLTLGDVFHDIEGRVHGRYREVTIEQILGHRGGLPLLPEGEMWDVLHSWGPDGETQRQVLAGQLLSAPPASWPGSTLYSNTGYAIAAAMMERVSGQSWEELVQLDIFEPLRMEHAGFGAPGSAHDVDVVEQPWGHRENEKGELVPVPPGRGADLPVAFTPASGVHVDLADWAQFAQLHLKGAQGRSVFLEPRTFEVLHTPYGRQAYGMGWSVQKAPWASGDMLVHAGSNKRWYSLAILVPTQDFGILVATNSGGESAREAVEEVSSELVDLLQRRRGKVDANQLVAIDR